uniref:Uncharacterized protein n=1 Tax=Eutreptiella gymnastica TaxID=73025 RepID=A0A7S4G4J9_9EUGL
MATPSSGLHALNFHPVRARSQAGVAPVAPPFPYATARTPSSTVPRDNRTVTEKGRAVCNEGLREYHPLQVRSCQSAEAAPVQTIRLLVSKVEAPEGSGTNVGRMRAETKNGLESV